MTILTRPGFYNIEEGKWGEPDSKQGIEFLFPNWMGDSENVVFIGGHDDDALAGSAILIDRLSNFFHANVYSIILTNAKNGFDPEKVILEYDEYVMHVLNRRRQTPKELVKGIKKDAYLKTEISDIILTEMENIRKHETVEAYSLVGVPESNIIYYTYDGENTIEDLNIELYIGMNVEKGKGIYRFLIETLREIGATRILTINPGDTHQGHKSASKVGRFIARRAKSNLPHLGKDAPIANNTEGMEGHYFTIYEQLETAEKRFPNNLPKYLFMGNDAQVRLKEKVLSVYKSQPLLLPSFNNLPNPDFEMYEPFEKMGNPIDKNYVNRILKQLEKVFK